jgi:hypothetical protein
MTAPQADERSETESALLKICTIDLHGEEAEQFSRWLDAVAEDGVLHAALPDGRQSTTMKGTCHEER